MKYSKKSKIIISISILLLLSIILGAGDLVIKKETNVELEKPPTIYVYTENDGPKVAILGPYHWIYKDMNTLADTDHPINFDYKDENKITLIYTTNPQLVIDSQRLKSDKHIDFTIDKIEVYKGRELLNLRLPTTNYTNGAAYTEAPKDIGEYIYVLHLNFGKSGTAIYGINIIVEKGKDPFTGN